MARIKVFKRVDGLWAWHLQADNNEIIATDGGQGYVHRDEAESTARRVAAGEFAVDEEATNEEGPIQ